MRSIFSLAILCIFSIQASLAQHQCGTEAYTRNHFKPAKEQPAIVLRGQDRDTVPNEIITIPVIVHLLFNTNEQNISDEQIKSQIDVLNKDFRRLNTDAVNTPDAFKPVAADTRIMFCLAKVTPDGKPTKGIIRKYTTKAFFLGDDGMKFSAAGGDDAWDSKKYLNIWVCTLFGRSLGYATIPGGDASLDGVVINYDVFGNTGFVRPPFNKGRTATHEVAHWLGLKHIWGDENCGSDDVDDTPRQKSYNYGCPVFPHVTSCSENASGDMFMNFMDFTDDACMNSFTYGQKMKMRSLFALGGTRNSFLYSFACDSSLASGGPLPDDTLPVIKPKASVNIYPNPAISDITITPVNDYILTGKTCSIYNVQGKLLLRQSFVSNREKINVTALPSGIYILKIGEGDEKQVVKLIKL